MILVTSAYGTQGRLLLPKLAAAGAAVRGLRLTAGGEAALIAAGATEAMTGDASDPAVMRAAMAGVRSVYHIGPSAHPREREMGYLAIEAALDAGVEHFVFSSVLHPILTDLVQHEVKRDIEERLVASRLNFTILQPSDYMQVLRYRAAFESGTFTLAWSRDRRQSVVDVGDVTDVAAKILLEGAEHHGATYELSAPGCFTAWEIGAIIAEACGRPIDVTETSPIDRMKDHFNDDGRDKAMDADAAYRLRVFTALRDWYSAHDFVGNPKVLAMLLGRPPTSLADFIAREHAAFAGAR